MSYFIQFLSHYFFAISISICLLIMIIASGDLSKHQLGVFYFIIGCTLTLCASEGLEIYFSNRDLFPTFNGWRVFLSVINYILRPGIFYLYVVMLETNKKRILWYLIPLVYNIILVSTSQWTHLVFHFDQNNVFNDSDIKFFRYTPHIVTFLYIALLFGYSIIIFRDRDFRKATFLLVMILFGIFSIVLESKNDVGERFYGFTATAIAISTTMMFLYFHVQINRIDPLTGLLNRKSFFVDSEKNSFRIKAIFSIDMNNLKIINDKQGHTAGDLALTTCADCIRRAVKNKGNCYRVGGDEFVVAYFRDDCEVMKLKLIDILAQTDYTMAIGYSEKDRDESFEIAYKRADHAMYENKIKMKKELSLEESAR